MPMKRILSYLAFAVLLVSACAKQEVETATKLREIRFVASVGDFQTKATDTAFEEGDRIGLTIAEPVGISNLMLKPDGQFLAPESPLFWPADMEQDQPARFVAYHPYEVSASADNFDVAEKRVYSIAEAQYRSGVYTQQDYMSAVTDAPPADGTVELRFKHLMSRFNIAIVDQLSTESFSDVQNDNFRSVEIGNLFTWVEVDFGQQSAEAKTEGNSYPVYPAQTGSKAYSLILPPQTVSPEIAIHLASGKTMTYVTDAPIAFPAGKQVSATLIVNEEAVSFSYEITDWVDDPIAVDLAKHSGTPPNNEIWYYTTDGDMMHMAESYEYEGEVRYYWDGEDIANWFNAEIESHTCENGVGVIRFKTDVTEVGVNGVNWVYAFQNVANLRAITFPHSVKLIGSGTFWGCPNLKTVHFPAHLEKLGDNLFGNCDAITELNIPEFDEVFNPNGAQYENQLFYCSNLAKFTGPYASEDGRCLIKDGTLLAIAPAGLTSFEVPEGVTEIRRHTFRSQIFQTISLPSTLQGIGAECFAYSNITQITLPVSLEWIDDQAFYSTRLSKVHIPAATELGKNVFDSCSYLREFSGRYASEDGRYLSRDNAIIAFAPAGLNYYSVPEGIVEIACDMPFNSVCLPASLERITGNRAFIGRWGTHVVVSMADVPPTWTYQYYTPGEGISIYVPAASVDAYKATEGWDAFGGYIRPLPQVSEAVDLGLPSGLKWASCNLGAIYPEEEGMFFCWGDVFPQGSYWARSTNRYYDEETYSWTKYNSDEDAWTELEAMDDAATHWLGADWRTPTYEDWDELLENCTSTYVTENGISGYRFEAENGNSIFLPGSVTSNYSIYWSSTLFNVGHAIIAYWSGSGSWNLSYTMLYYSAYVRPVFAGQE